MSRPVAPAKLAAMTEAARIACDRKGKWFSQDVLLAYSKPVPVAEAIAKVKNGKTVFVRREDAAEVLASIAGEV